jgi:hypothetical protein
LVSTATGVSETVGNHEFIMTVHFSEYLIITDVKVENARTAMLVKLYTCTLGIKVKALVKKKYNLKNKIWVPRP